MKRYICVHGHFYQPPRENPWLEAIELQDSAYPFHDWNTRITQECYSQNAASRILDDERNIVDIVNNYSRMSFNFGPTLLDWLQEHAPEVYVKILEADHLGQERFSGHGPALAQPYNHMIMPLANRHDKLTQVLWGIEDFKSHFQREPEGMWLPETAVDTATLEVLADRGIRFTILAPHQAARIRRCGETSWNDVTEQTLNTGVPYLCHLPSGRDIVLFFYQGPVSHDVAYGGLLHSGLDLADRLVQAFPDDEPEAHLVHIATDGESFGHHHRYGDMALAYCLHHIESQHLAQVTIYGEFLEKHPPQHDVEINENTSWSCSHGIERWRDNCGCVVFKEHLGKQQWRRTLRDDMNWLRNRLFQLYQQKMAGYNNDPWGLRNAYIAVLRDRSRSHVDQFVARHAKRDKLSYEDQVTFLQLLEMQRNAMLMFTSCGWFFDDLNRLEPVQIMKYAARAMQLCQEIFDIDLEPEFKQRLEEAPCPDAEMANGRAVYETLVQPGRTDLSRVGAHVALTSVFKKRCEESVDIFCYTMHMQDCRRLEAGAQVLITSRAVIESQVTLQQHNIELAVFYLGDHHIFGAVRGAQTPQAFTRLAEQVQTAFRRGDTNEVIRLLNTAFDGKSYSLSHLFRDQQRRILDRLLKRTHGEIAESLRHIYDHNYAILKMARHLDMPLSDDLAAAPTFVLNRDILQELRNETVDMQRLRDLVEETKAFRVRLDSKRLAYEVSQRIRDWMRQLTETPNNMTLLEQINQTLALVIQLVENLDLHESQNIFFELCKTHLAAMKERSKTDDPMAARWLQRFQQLADHLGLAIA